MNRSLFAVAGVITLFGVGLIGFFSLMAGSLLESTTNLGEFADGFFESVANDELTSARDFLSADFSNSMNDDELEQFVMDYRLDQFVNSWWTSQTINKSQGQLTGAVETVTGQKIPVQVGLIFEMQKWKIDSLEPQNNPSSATQQTASNSNEPFESPIPDYDLETTSGVEDSDFQAASAPSLQTVKNNNDPVTAQNVSAAIKDKTLGQQKIWAKPSILTINDIPDFEAANKMAKLWTTMFCKGVSEKDFSSFHGQLAPQMQDKFPLSKFTKVFQKFIDQDIDLGWVKNVNPLLDQNPSLDANGVLLLKGHFPAEPKVNFEYSFKRIENSWKPVSINLTVPNKEEYAVNVIPTAESLKKVVIATTQAFGKSVANKDFSSFHRSTYSKFQKKFSVKQFSKYFESFIDQEADLKWIDGIQPIFDITPSLNLNGFLSLEGHFPAEPKVLFRYAFIKEDGKWKVSTVNLSIADKEDEDEQVATDVKKDVN